MDTTSASVLFERFGGLLVGGFPVINSPVFATAKGTSYLRTPAVVMLSRPAVNLTGMRGFLEGFPGELDFANYLSDSTQLTGGIQLCKAAGQICYLSLGKSRTLNKNADKYFENIKSSGHGSVLEHASYSFLLYGVSRSFTHELVRHRAGTAYSQTSQRYVGPKSLRFVERPEYQLDPNLHADFENDIDSALERYQERIRHLLEAQGSENVWLTSESQTDARKRVQQAARSTLTNDVEAPIVMSGNIRAFRHICELRVSEHAETEMRQAILRLLLCLTIVEPILFSDYSFYRLHDGTFSIKTDFRKV